MEKEIKEKKIKEDLEEEDLSKIVKEQIIGSLVIKFTRNDGSFYVGTDQLSVGWDGFGENDEFYDEKDQVIGIIPAPPCSYKVLGLFPCEEENYPYPKYGSYEFLGYEFTGANCPDWVKLLEERIKGKEERRNKEEKLKKGDLSDITFEEGYRNKK